ncbi:hypothetical protein, partial [Streptomyces sp. NPDC051561]|uniref:hypothetical protein n=1 Tax=Streptomyces sp. NPDC051561 TaxID=3365658 RepID=UPI0037AE6D81
ARGSLRERDAEPLRGSSPGRSAPRTPVHSVALHNRRTLRALRAVGSASLCSSAPRWQLAYSVVELGPLRGRLATEQGSAGGSAA